MKYLFLIFVLGLPLFGFAKASDGPGIKIPDTIHMKKHISLATLVEVWPQSGDADELMILARVEEGHVMLIKPEDLQVWRGPIRKGEKRKFPLVLQMNAQGKGILILEASEVIKGKKLTRTLRIKVSSN